MIHKIVFSLLVSMLMSVSLFAQWDMNISANYSLPLSTEFSKNYQNGYGGDMEISYQFKESGFGMGIHFGLVGFRANKAYEQELVDANHTIFVYDYKINLYSFPLLAHARYTFFRDDNFHIIPDIGIGIEFMEKREKQIGKHTSDYNKHYSNEFTINPNISVSYNMVDDVAAILKVGYHQTLGMYELSYVDINLGVIYKL